MREFFSFDGPFNRYGGMVADMIILSFMWLLFSIIGLGLTIGASTTAMFYVSTRRIANREGYITRDFWEAFKANFKRATLLWLMILILLLLIYFNINHIEVVGGMAVIIFPAQIILFVEIVLVSIYIFPMAARFDMGIKQLIKSSFFMANRHLLTSVSCAVLLAATVVFFLAMPHLAIFVGPGIYAWLSSYMIMRIFKRYRPEMDKDPVLEIQEIEAQKTEERRKRSIGSMQTDNADEVVDEAAVEAALWTSLSEARTDEPEQTDDAHISDTKPPEPVTKEVKYANAEEAFWASLTQDETDDANERKPWEAATLEHHKEAE